MIYKSSAAYSFGKGKKETDSSFLNKSRLKNPSIYEHKGAILTEPSKGYTFSKEAKLKTRDNQVPGVWRYNTIYSTDFGKSNKNKFTMPKTVRKDIVDKSKTCSSVKNKDDITALEPGKYNIVSTFGTEGIKPKLRGKPKEIQPFKVPGPGQYDNGNAKIKTLKKNPTTCMGFGKRVDISEREKKKNIPVAKYNFKSEFDVSNKEKIKAITFPKSKRMEDIKNLTPGPGAYHLPCSFGVVASYENIIPESKFKNV